MRLVPDDARVRGRRGECRAGCRGPTLQLGREEEVGQLGAAVGDLRVVALRGVALEHGAVATVMGDRGHRGDPRRRGGQQVRHEQPGQREVAEVVRAELQLEPVGGHAVLGRGHDAGVVDEEVEGPVEAVCQCVHRLLRGEVEPLDAGGARHAGPADPLGRGVTQVGVADREHDVGAVPGQLERLDVAEARVGPGDECGGPGEVADPVGCPAHGCSLWLGQRRVLPPQYASRGPAPSDPVPASVATGRVWRWSRWSRVRVARASR